MNVKSIDGFVSCLREGTRQAFLFVLPILAFCVLGLSARAEEAAVETVYVDATNGNDENDGRTPETAVATMNAVSFNVAKAEHRIVLSDGEYVLQYAGCYSPDRIEANHSATNHIRLKTGDTICGIDFERIDFISGCLSSIEKCSFVDCVITNCVFQRSNYYYSTVMVKIEDCDFEDCVISNCTFQGSSYSSVFGNSTFDRSLICENVCSESLDDYRNVPCLFSGCSFVNSILRNNRHGADVREYGGTSGQFIYASNLENCLIVSNSIINALLSLKTSYVNCTIMGNHGNLIFNGDLFNCIWDRDETGSGAKDYWLRRCPKITFTLSRG